MQWGALGCPWEALGAPGCAGLSLGGTGIQRDAYGPVRTHGGAAGSSSGPALLPGNACRRLRMRSVAGAPAKTTSPSRLCGALRPAVAGQGPSPGSSPGAGGGSRTMAEAAAGSRPPPDVDSDECLREYGHLFSPDILAGQVAFITGGGSGIGFRIAEIFMRHGCRTVIASRNLQRVVEASKKLVAATGQQCLPLSIDVRQPQTIAAAVDEALGEFKRIDILVNGAAGNFLCPASALSFNAFKTVIDIDTIGTFNTSKVLFEKYFHDHGGVIVNITATLSYRGQALQVHAGTAKAAIDAMTRHLAVEWGPNNVRVNSLAPGPITGTEGYRRLASCPALMVAVHQWSAGSALEAGKAVLGRLYKVGSLLRKQASLT
ncbi:peroxisomal 2,4-dienoyl-CoA reductase [(3E)-enoyl-CoA-producing] isoform 3-T3 [Amazona ochrocephala]